MVNRYTIEELQTFSDYEMLYAIVRDRQGAVTNAYSPMNDRLQKLMSKLSKKEKLTSPKGDLFLYPGMLEMRRQLEKNSAKCVKCGGLFSKQEFDAGFMVCEHCPPELKINKLDKKTKGCPNGDRR